MPQTGLEHLDVIEHTGSRRAPIRADAPLEPVLLEHAEETLDSRVVVAVRRKLPYCPLTV